ncbi:MAG TPA: acyl-CoA thioesterase [Thermoanaerobaculia bacterium]|nr:acyl-CoA thioesterase [Thermoanaerobaculia bacterium]
MSDTAPTAPPPAPDAGPVQPAIRVIMMPKDTNALGTIFGGIILSYIDQAGAVEGSRHVAGRLVTVAMDEVVFHQPVFVGDLVSFYTETLRRGRTSVTVRVTVEAQRRHRPGGFSRVKVTDANLTFVHVDEDNRPIPLEQPSGAPGSALLPSTGTADSA